MNEPKTVTDPGRHDWRALHDLVEPRTSLPPALAAARALVESFALFDRGVRMMRMNLVRAHPDASEAEITLLLRRWLAERAGAPHGDGVGRPARDRLARILSRGD